MSSTVRPRRSSAPRPASGRLPDLSRIERRAFGMTCEIRTAKAGAKMPGFQGYAAVYTDLSLPLGDGRGKFVERIQPGCFDSCLAAGADIRVLQNHNSDLVLGRTSSGTATVSSDSRGLLVDCRELPDTTYARDLVVMMDRGDVDQMSFGFIATDDDWSAVDPMTGLPIRDLLAADVFDCSVVTFPAYPSTTAEVRSIAESRRPVVTRMQN